jgi:hypothetical protein
MEVVVGGAVVVVSGVGSSEVVVKFEKFSISTPQSITNALKSNIQF